MRSTVTLDDALIRAAFDDNPMPMWTCDPRSRRLTAVNHAVGRMYGYTRDELLGMPISHLEAPAEPGDDTARLHRHRRKDGSSILVELSGHDIRTGELPLQLVTIFDVTEREAARHALQRSQAQLEHAHKMDALGRLASGVAHDLNSILMIVQTAAYMLQESFSAGDLRVGETTEIERAVQRAVKLTRQLLAMSRQSVGSPKPLRVNEIISGLAPGLSRLLGPGITIDVQASSVPLVVADAGQLEQVVLNLAVNARDAMGGAGRVVVGTSLEVLEGDRAELHDLPAGRYVVLTVTDSGHGIDPEIRSRIFDPFFTTKPPGQGTGLGLSIVQGIVAQAGGTIEVYSDPGQGTSFHVRLPVAEGVEAVPVEAARPVPSHLRPVTVLFVDHIAELRGVMSRALHGMGCTVIEAGSAAAARDACVRHDGAIDVAVIDIALPDGGGTELARVLRELRPELRVVLMSGFPVAALGPSGDVPIDVLAKPFTPGELRDAIAAATSDGAPPNRTSETSMLSRVLVVDDDPSLRKMLVRFLSRAQFDVTDADSGRGALAQLAQRRFDVILSDIHMADGDGLELLRSLRRIDLDVPVILMSGKPDVATAAAALEFGAFRYLTKPLENDAVERVVRQAARANALARLRREAVRVGGGTPGATDRAGLEVRFENAIADLWMAYQPIVDAKTGALFGVEALMRSREPSLPTPPSLLDAATSLGRLHALGRRTRDLAGATIAARADIPILFMNLHPVDLLDMHLADGTSALTKIAPRVILEVTERESLVASAELTARIARLRELGFRLAVDDIGAGYSGLTSFTDLMPEIVKIDMSLVRNIHSSTVKQRTVGALCSLCHEIGASVVGEGVETVDERECLIALGCDLLQGYLIARPGELPRLLDVGAAPARAAAGSHAS
jgi:PAS domain S-box-containing protein